MSVELDNRRMVPELLILVKAGGCCRNRHNFITHKAITAITRAITKRHLFQGHRCCNALCGLYAAFVGHRFVHIWHWIYPVAQRRKGWGAPTNIVCLESKITRICIFSSFSQLLMKQPVSTTSTLLSCLRYQTLKMANHGLRNFATSWEVVILASPTSQATCHAFSIIFPCASFSDLVSP